MAFLASTEALLRIAVVPKDIRLKHYELFENSTARNAAFGDSQMAATITGVPGFMNFAYGGENFVITEYRVRKYFSDRKPGRVIIQANPNNFATYKEDMATSNWTTRYIAGLDKVHDTIFLSTLPLFRMYIWEYWKTALTRGAFESTVYLTKDGARFTRPEAKKPLTDKQFMREARKYFRSRSPSADFRHEATYRSFLSVLTFLKVRGADVCLVTTPFAKDYRRLVVDSPVIQQIFADFDALAHSYGFRRFNAWNAANDNRMFANTDHLNEVGAQAVTPLIMAGCFGDQSTGARGPS